MNKMSNIGEQFKKFPIFFAICLLVVGMLSAPIALFSYHSYFPAVCSLLVDAAASPYLISLIRKLLA